MVLLLVAKDYFIVVLTNLTYLEHVRIHIDVWLVVQNIRYRVLHVFSMKIEVYFYTLFLAIEYTSGLELHNLIDVSNPNNYLTPTMHLILSTSKSFPFLETFISAHLLWSIYIKFVFFSSSNKWYIAFATRVIYVFFISFFFF